jgi:biotin synthase
MKTIESILTKLYEARVPNVKDIVSLLSIDSPRERMALFNFADQIRKQYMGDEVLLRGIIEFSNYCGNTCFYCGLNKNNSKIKRYRLTKEEILSSVESLISYKIKTVILQSGEDSNLDSLWLCDVIKTIKSRYDTAVTLSVGEKSYGDYKMWKEAGADRYLLKIETSNETLYKILHPDMSFSNRIECLKNLKKLGYEVGSGNIIGLKGQTLKIIADDILFFKKKNFDMIGIGPFIPHSVTELAEEKKGDADLTLKVIALTRIIMKNSHLPATTALGSMEQDYRRDALKAGANVLMVNFTPSPYRSQYELYPGKRCIDEPQGVCAGCAEKIADSIGRVVEYRRGDSLKK